MTNLLRVGMLSAGLLLATGGAGGVRAQVVTPPNCHWADAGGVSQLWCPGPDGRMQATGQTAQWSTPAKADGCPNGQLYDGVRCVPEGRDRLARVAAPAGAEVAAPAARARGGSKLADGLERLVQLDSRSWMMNTYDVGSVSDVRVVSHTKSGSTVFGRYTYNRGSAGWVRARLKGGEFTCVEFWDFPGRCRTVGDSDSRKVVAAGLIMAISGGGGGGGGGGGTSGYGDRDPRDLPHQGYSPPAYTPAPPVAPIGGERGLYGSDHSCC